MVHGDYVFEISAIMDFEDFARQAHLLRISKALTKRTDTE
jgi:hypothetical protein